MTKKRSIALTSGIITLVISVFILADFQSNIVGAFIGVTPLANSFLSSFFGVIFMISSIVLFAVAHSGLEKITLSSAIKKTPSLLRLTKYAVKNQMVGRELNHLVKELSKGNFEAGLGRPGHIYGTDVHYLRGRNEGRLYYHRIGENNYEIVAKSAKGRNQDQVIKKVKEIYRN